MVDTVTELEGSVVHHGPLNDRAYLLKLRGRNPAGAAEALEKLARKKSYSKIIAKIPAAAKEEFQAAGYRQEAAIPGFFPDRQELCFMAKYLHPDRRTARHAQKIVEVLESARKKARSGTVEKLPSPLCCRAAGPDDAAEMADLYRKVFATYPFPIQNPEYLKQTMAENVAYFGVWEENRLAALASAEMDVTSSSAEMTDFATHPDYRGGGFATHLLHRLEQEMMRRKIGTAYTIARAVSFGMNITFARRGYRFGGTLANNTQISGSLESMNVWYKSLSLEPPAA